MTRKTLQLFLLSAVLDAATAHAQLLERLSHARARDLSIACRDPLRFQMLPPALRQTCASGAQPPAVSTGTNSAAPVASCSGGCEGTVDLFSPGAYLVNVLEFVKRSWPDLDTQAKINGRFYQWFEAVPVTDGTSEPQAKYTAEVLENLIMVLDGKTPWDGGGSGTPAQRRERRKYIYDQEMRDAKYAKETRFTPTVVSDVFDAYLRELGTTREAMRLIAGLGDRDGVKVSLAREQGLDIREKSPPLCDPDPRDGLRLADIEAFARGGESLTALDAIREQRFGSGYGAVYRAEWRKAAVRLAEETAQALADDERRAFTKHLRAVRAEAQRCVLDALMPGIGEGHPTDDAYLTRLAVARQKAKDCVAAGGSDCPAIPACRSEGHPVTLPITPLIQLFAHYADVFPAPPGAAECPAEPDTEKAQSCAWKHWWVRHDALGLKLRNASGLDPALPLPPKDETRIAEQLASDEELDLHIERLASEQFRRRCAAGGATDFLARVDAHAADGWRAIVAKAEGGFLVRIRSNLIAIALHKMNGRGSPYPDIDASGPELVTDANVGRLARWLHVDLTVDESYRTTRIASAISRLHSFIQAADLATGPGAPAPFDRAIWRWIQSYGTWHAGTVVSAYPESFLIPEARRTITPDAQAVMEEVDDGADPRELQSRFAERVARLAGIRMVTAVPAAGGVLVVSADPKGNVFSSLLRPDGTWAPWTRAGALKGRAINLAAMTAVWTGPRGAPTGGFLIGHTTVWHWDSLTTGPYAVTSYSYAKLEVRGEQAVLSGGEDLDWKELENAQERSSGFDWKHVFVSDAEPGKFKLNVLHSLTASRLHQWSVTVDGDELKVTQAFDSTDTFYANVAGVASDPFGTTTLHCKAPPVGGGVVELYSGRQKLPVASQDVANCSQIAVGWDKSSILFSWMRPDGQAVVARRNGATLDVVGRGAAGSKRGFTRIAAAGDVTLAFGGEDELYHARVTLETGPGTMSAPSRFLHSRAVMNMSSGMRAGERWAQFTSADLDRVYVDEYLLHLPMFAAARLNESGRFADARDQLLAAAQYPGFDEGGVSIGDLGMWLEDPFDPYANADLHRETYRLGVKLAHMQNLLDWADRLFTSDTTESVNRARQLYETVQAELGSMTWPADGCTLVPVQAAPAAPPSPTNTQPSSGAGMVGRATTSAPPRTGPLPLPLASLLARRGDAKLQAQRRGQSAASKLMLQHVAQAAAARNALAASASADAWLFGMDVGFCVRRNPIATLLAYRADANIAKIRTNRNFAGMSRELRPYATPVDPKKLVKQSSGTLEVAEYVPSLPPPIYRYSFLVQRAQQLASTAQQLETAMLQAIEKEEEASYRLMQARQDLRLERGNVTLQALRVLEAEDGLDLAKLQTGRARFQQAHYQALVDSSLTAWEIGALASMYLSSAVSGTMAVAAFLATPMKGGEAAQSGATSLSTLGQALSTQASYDRREQEWEFQRDIAQRDINLALAGETLAQDRIAISSQEKAIAELRLDGATDAVEFLQDRFTNAALYRFMRQNLRRLYREQLNLAISTAKAAQQAFEFERQTSFDFIAYDYWDEERSGLVGAERLLRDIDKMNTFRIGSATRRKEIEKTISLASAIPAEFQTFRRTGRLDFETPMRWFDRDFPGHYMRLVRDVNVSVLALVPPTESIHATLSNPGMSRVMVGPPFEDFATLYRLPESIALSSANRATGLFELRPDDPMLYPFEGSGVASTWRLEMPRGANRLSFDTIYDVLLTVRYTALDDSTYREKVLDAMGRDEDGWVTGTSVRYFSVRNDFPDQWYQLLNPVIGLPANGYWDPVARSVSDGKPQLPYTAVLDVSDRDFLPNEERRSIRKVTVAMQVSENVVENGESFAQPLTIRLRDGCGRATLDPDRFVSRVEGIGAGRPYGAWTIDLARGCDISAGDAAPTTGALADAIRKRVQDLWVIVEYRSVSHYGR